jgi:hypothetical protein
VQQQRSMRTFSYISAAAASPPLRQQWPGISWRRHSRQLQCRRSQQDYSAAGTRHDDQGDSRLRQNAGIFRPSIWGDFFLGYSNPAAPNSSQQQVCSFIDVFPLPILYLYKKLIK